MSPDVPVSISVLIVDDDPFVVDHLSEYLATAPDLVLLGTCTNGVEAIAQVQQRSPDVILMDVQMPVMDGVQATRRISQLDPSIRIVALTTFGDDDAVATMLRAGAAGFLLKTTEPRALADAIRAAHAGHTILPPDTARRWSLSHRRPAGPELSDRERQVIDLVAEGLNNREIGRAMFVSASTVKKHLADLMDKLGVRSRAQAVAKAHEFGLISRPDQDEPQ